MIKDAGTRQARGEVVLPQGLDHKQRQQALHVAPRRVERVHRRPHDRPPTRLHAFQGLGGLEKAIKLPTLTNFESLNTRALRTKIVTLRLPIPLPSAQMVLPRL